jgi:hypothetical protein
MSLRFENLSKSPKTFLRRTGVTVSQFLGLVERVRPQWKSFQSTKKVEGRPYGLGVLENHLLALLLYYRTYTTYLFLGYLFGVDETTVMRAVKRLEPLLAGSVGIKKDRTLTEKELSVLIVDATEQQIERPKKKQSVYYSGRKKKHTLKVEVQVNGGGKIVRVSKPYPGSQHDFSIRKEESPLPAGSWVLVDSGYQGILQFHKTTEVPKRRGKNQPLTPEEREYNKALASLRVQVEHLGSSRYFKSSLNDTGTGGEGMG